MSQDQRRNGHPRTESPAVQVPGAQDVASRRPDSGSEAAPTESVETVALTPKARRAVAIRAAKARWSGRKKHSAA